MYILYIFLKYLVKTSLKSVREYRLLSKLFFFALRLKCKIPRKLNRVYIGYLANCGNNSRETIIDKKRIFVIDRQSTKRFINSSVGRKRSPRAYWGINRGGCDSRSTGAKREKYTSSRKIWSMMDQLVVVLLLSRL